MKTVFLSGSRAISRLNNPIRERLENITTQSFDIIIGDANGADKALQSFLSEQSYPNVTVYCSGLQCRNNIGSWETHNVEVPSNIRGREFYTMKDRVMAECADYGFVLWDGKSPGSIQNVITLLKRGKKALVYFSPDQEFLLIGNVDNLKSLVTKTSLEALDKMEKKIKLEQSIIDIEQGIQAEIQLGLC